MTRKIRKSQFNEKIYGFSIPTKIYGISIRTIDRQFILLVSQGNVATKTTDGAVRINDKNKENSFQNLEN